MRIGSEMVKLLTPDEVADLLGIKVSTIYQWTHQGYIPHVKVSRFVRFDPRVIDRWLQTLSKSGRATKRIDLKELGL
jgi:excisionase family DNA binding protein